jgi:hypothetical protein
MAGHPQFNHIHCSSRYDRPASDLEKDMDDWMEKCSVITVTEVENDNRAATMREKGWEYYNAKRNNGQDMAGIAWKRETWYCPWRATRKLHTETFRDVEGVVGLEEYVHAAAVVLRHTTSGSKLLVSVARMPSGLAAAERWSTLEAGWRARKAAYIECNNTWSRWIENVRIANKVDGIIVAGDWNLDLKMNWVRLFLTQNWGERMPLTWKDFPTTGTSPSSNKVMDGTLARHLESFDGATMMDRVRSSDHRPYKETLKFKLGEITVDPTAGDTYEGEIWWGFGDYVDDEIYFGEKDWQLGSVGGEVL